VSTGYAKSYLKGVTGRLQNSEDSTTRQEGQYYTEQVPVQREYRTSPEQGMTEEDILRYCEQTKYCRRKNLLRIREPEYRTEKINPLV
jgi:hypothetical protein